MVLLVGLTFIGEPAQCDSGDRQVGGERERAIDRRAAVERGFIQELRNLAAGWDRSRAAVETVARLIREVEGDHGVGTAGVGQSQAGGEGAVDLGPDAPGCRGCRGGNASLADKNIIFAEPKDGDARWSTTSGAGLHPPVAHRNRVGGAGRGFRIGATVVHQERNRGCLCLQHSRTR